MQRLQALLGYADLIPHIKIPISTSMWPNFCKKIMLSLGGSYKTLGMCWVAGETLKQTWLFSLRAL